MFRQLCVCACVCVLDAYRYAFIAGRVNSSLGLEAFWRASALSNKTEEPNLNFDITKNTLFLPRPAPPLWALPPLIRLEAVQAVQTHAMRAPRESKIQFYFDNSRRPAVSHTMMKTRTPNTLQLPHSTAMDRVPLAGPVWTL